MLAQSHRIRLYAWLGLLAMTCVAADAGDDFSNNLFSDLSPLLALFGERVTMQFMSGSMGWADNIILAMAPLGIITIVVSAIRVGGPSWLKALIGRARENLAAAEVELMSSTSDEVCELWNGREMVRCMGSAPVVELICLLPRNKSDAKPPATEHERSSTKLKSFRNLFGFTCRLPTEDEPVAKTPPAKSQNSSSSLKTFCIESTDFGKVLHEFGKSCEGDCKPCAECGKKCTGCWKVCKAFCETCKAYYKSWTESCKTCGRTCNSGACCVQPRTDLESGTASSATQSQQASSEMDNNSLQKFSITRNLDQGSPNVSLNIHGPSSRFELVLVAVIGTILQLGVLVYAWFATYYPTLKFLKDDDPVATYAYPCTTAGTLLLVLGIAICAHVVDSSTKEREFATKDEREIRVIWLQQQKTVSDQVFKSCAIYARKPQLSFKSSRRREKSDNQDQTDAQTSSLQENEADGTQLEKPQLGLGIETVLGTIVTLSGFVLQFVGLRGMHWSISIAQLGAVLMMLMFKAWVRRRLASPPRIKELAPGFELDWLARTLGNDGYASYEHWRGKEQQGRLFDWVTLSKERQEGQWIILSDKETKLEDTKDSSIDDTESQPVQSCAEAILIARKELGSLANWHGIAYDEAVCLSKAIEVTMDTLFKHDNNTIGNEAKRVEWEWELPVHCDETEQKIVLKEYRDENVWKGDVNAIDAAISLWLSSTNTESGESMGPAEFVVRDKAQASPGTPSRSPKNEVMDRSQFKVPSAVRGKRSLGVYTSDVERDLKWWVPRDSLRYTKLNANDAELLTIGNPKVSKPSSQNATQQARGPLNKETSPHGRHDTTEEVHNTRDVNHIEHLATEFHGSQKILYAQSLFSLFMRAVAKKLREPVKGGIDELLPESTAGGGDWKSFQLRNNTLSGMIQDVHQTGLGGMAEIYTSIVAPLSQAGRLPGVDKVVEWVREHAEVYIKREDWARLGGCLEWLPEIAVTLSTTARAEAILMAHLRRVSSLDEFRREQNIKIVKPSAHEPLPERFADVLEKLRKRRQELTEEIRSQQQKLIEDMRSQRQKLTEEIRSQQQKLTEEIRSQQQKLIEDMRSQQQKLTEEIRSQQQKLTASQITNLAKLFESEPKKDLKEPKNFLLPKKLTNVKESLVDQDEESLEYSEAFNVTQQHYVALRWSSSRVSQTAPKGNANAKDVLDRTPAHYAAVTGYMTVFSLQMRGEDLNAEDLLGWTPLHYACWAEDIGRAQRVSPVEELVQAGVDLDRQARDGATPLHCAVSQDHSDRVRQLVEAGAIADMRDSRGSSPIHLAAYNGNSEIVNILLKGGSQTLRDRFGRTALHQAALAGKKEIIDILLANDIFAKDLEAKDRIGQTPLSLAVDRGQLECVQALLEKGTDINSKDGQERTPLHWAVSSGHADCTRALLEKGADHRLVDKNGADALHHAIEQPYIKSIESIKTLIKYGADIETMGRKEMRPLRIAAGRGHRDVVELLLSCGADVNGTSRDGKTALNVDVKEEIRKLLQSARTPPCQILDRAPHTPPCAVAV